MAQAGNLRMKRAQCLWDEQSPVIIPPKGKKSERILPVTWVPACLLPLAAGQSPFESIDDDTIRLYIQGNFLDVDSLLFEKIMIGFWKSVPLLCE